MNIAKTGAAFGLAALTLASSLSLGAAANAAPASPSTNATFEAQLITPGIGGTFWGTKPNNYVVVPYASLAAAKTEAGRHDILYTGETSPEGTPVFEISYDQAHTFCITAQSYDGLYYLGSGACDLQTPSNKFFVNKKGGLANMAYPTLAVDRVWTYAAGTSYYALGNSQEPLKFSLSNAEASDIDVYNRTATLKGQAQPGVTVEVKIGSTNRTVQADAETGEWSMTVRGLELGANKGTLESFDAENESLVTSEFTVDVKTTPLSAQVKSTNLATQTAEVEITGTPGLTINYQGKSATLNQQGTKTVTFDGLSLGNNDVTIQQFEGATQIGGDLGYKINMMFTKVTAEAKFDPQGNNFNAILSGRSEGSAKITIIDGNGKITTTDATPQGAWSTPVAAPGAGRQNFEVSQSVSGGDGGSVDVELNYGNGVEIDRPGNNTGFAGGTLSFSGEGQYKGNVEVFEKGNDTALMNTVALNSGSWSLQVSNVDGDLKHTYTVKMLSQGNLTTEDTVVVNAEKPEQKVAPLVVQGPSENQTIVHPNGRVDFHGTGQKDAPIHIETSTGIVLGDGKVGANGQWSVSTWRKVPADYTANVTQGTGATAESKTVHYTLKLTEAVSMPFAIDTPTEGSTITDPMGHVTFQGKGAAGAKVQAITKGGANLGSAEVGLDGTWTIQSWRPMAADYTVNVTQSGTGVTAETKTVHYKLQMTSAVNKPFRILTPTEGSNFSDPNGLVVFTGEGKAGAKINAIRGAASQIGSVEVENDGTWTMRTWLPNNADYTVKITEDGGNEKVVHFHFEKK